MGPTSLYRHFRPTVTAVLYLDTYKAEHSCVSNSASPCKQVNWGHDLQKEEILTLHSQGK